MLARNISGSFDGSSPQTLPRHRSPISRSPPPESTSSSSSAAWRGNLMFALLLSSLMYLYFLHTMHESPHSAHIPDASSGDLLENFYVLHSNAGKMPVPQLHYYSSFRRYRDSVSYARDVLLSTVTSDALSSTPTLNAINRGDNGVGKEVPLKSVKSSIACRVTSLSLRTIIPGVSGSHNASKALDAYMERANQYLDVCPGELLNPHEETIWSTVMKTLEALLGPLHERTGSTLPMELLHALFPPVARAAPFDTTGLLECSPILLRRYCKHLKKQIDDGFNGRSAGSVASEGAHGGSEGETEVDHGFTIHSSELATDDDGDVGSVHPGIPTKTDRYADTDTDTDTGVSLGSNSTVDMSDMLIVLTACNQLNFTLTALDYMKRAFSNEDIEEGQGRGHGQYLTIGKPPAVLIVDDHSSDNTTDILRALGYFVVRTNTARGVTYAWNLGYKIAKLLGRYSSVVFMNNDVLIPKGSMELIHSALKKHAVVLPTTSLKGAGHNQRQAVSALMPVLFEEGGELSLLVKNRFHRLDFFMTNPMAAQLIQDMLLRMRCERLLNIYGHSPNGDGDAKALHNHDFTLVSTKFGRGGRQVGRFNGFMFAMNLAAISKHGLAYDSSKNDLFDPAALMIGQEDQLSNRMTAKGIFPVIEPYAYMYHFKSATVKVFGSDAKEALTVNNQTFVFDSRNNLEKYHSTKQNYSVYESLEFLSVYPRHDTRGHEGPHVQGSALKVDVYSTENECKCDVHCPPVIQFAGIQSYVRCQSVKPVVRKTKKAPRNKAPKSRTKAGICIGVRSIAPGRRQKRVRNMLFSFLQMYAASEFNSQVTLRLFISHSDSDNELFSPGINASVYDAIPALDANGTAKLYSKTLKRAVDVMNHNAEGVNMKYPPIPFAQIVRPQYMEYFNRSRFSRFYNRYYSYFMTDMLLDYMLETAPKFDVRCDWIMITDADVVFDATWFDTIANIILQSIGSDRLLLNKASNNGKNTGTSEKKVVDIIGWTIDKKRGTIVTPFSANEKAGMSIASMIVRRHLYLTPYTDVCFLNNRAELSSGRAVAGGSGSNTQLRPLHEPLPSPLPLPLCAYETVRFLPDALVSTEYIARDFFTLRTLLRNSIRLVHDAHDVGTDAGGGTGTGATKLQEALVILPQILAKVPGH